VHDALATKPRVQVVSLEKKGLKGRPDTELLVDRTRIVWTAKKSMQRTGDVMLGAAKSLLGVLHWMGTGKGLVAILFALNGSRGSDQIPGERGYVDGNSFFLNRCTQHPETASPK